MKCIHFTKQSSFTYANCEHNNPKIVYCNLQIFFISFGLDDNEEKRNDAKKKQRKRTDKL